jgi:hypothetical protein
MEAQGVGLGEEIKEGCACLQECFCAVVHFDTVPLHADGDLCELCHAHAHITVGNTLHAGTGTNRGRQAGRGREINTETYNIETSLWLTI